MKNSFKFLGISLCLLLMLTTLGCQKENPSEDENTTNNTSNNKNEIKFTEIDYSKPVCTVEEIKKEFLGGTSKYEFKPFYNVEPTTEFTFHFNSAVDPIKAITVHTDSKCEPNSTINQLNEGYKTETGVDVVVCPPSVPILNSEYRNDYKENDSHWGYAQIYYLCIRYDLDSTSTKELESPIIIPFTIKKEINVPNAYASIDSNGVFSMKWDKVDDAVKYKIYSSSAPSAEEARKYSREECGYAGEYLTLKETLDANQTQYLGDILLSKEEAEIKYSGDPTAIFTHTRFSNYINTQNDRFPGQCFITAVDKDGNESLFSKPVCKWQYDKYLPYKVDAEDLGYVEGKYYIDEFPDTILVNSISSSSFNGKDFKVSYPINYKKAGTPSTYAHTCTYTYEIVGTELTGEVSYYNENDIFPEEHISPLKLNRLPMPEISTDNTVPIDVDQIVDEEYSNSTIDLLTKVNYPEESKIKLSASYLLIRNDLMLGKSFNSGIFDKSSKYFENIKTPYDIKTYVVPDNFEYIKENLYDKNNNPIGYTVSESGNTEYLAKTTYYLNGKKDITVTPNEKYTPTPEETFKPRTINPEPEKEITSQNYAEEQRKSTKKQVTKANQEKVQDTSYPIIAENAGQKYLALKLINQEENISLKAFPNYQNPDELFADLLFVWYQNPYIMGIDPNECSYDYQNQIVKIKYNVNKDIAQKQQNEVYNKSKEVVKEIIKDNMTDEEKVFAIYEYLEKNSAYNMEAFNYSLNGDGDFYTKYANSWNTYGILCENTGVCQSYAYSFNLLARLSGLKTLMVVGTMNNGGHAWNCVKLDDKWYMVDVTNNGKATNGIDYWICASSTDFIERNGFVLDDSFIAGADLSEFNNSDTSKDWYSINKRNPQSIAECAKIWYELKDTQNPILLKYQLEGIEEKRSFWKNFKKEAKNLGATDEELSKWKVYEYSGVLMLKKQ